ncbi:MAG: aminotransferase class V-fold PLP-dependent enzyme [Longimicrobiales bacterium]
MNPATAPRLDVERLREDTPATRAGIVHLNNAGAALMPRPVLDTVRRHLDLEEQLGGYEAADHERARVDAAYGDVARLIGAAARNVAVVENATVGFAQALSSFDFTAGDVILTTRNDYISNQLMYLSLARRRGVEIVRAADAPEGGVDIESLRSLAEQRRPKLVALTWVPTNSGLVQPAEAVGRLCSELDVPYVVDACQAVGQLPIDVERIRCDFLSATARKFLRGPRGIGFLYVSQRVLDAGTYPLWLDMRGARWLAADRFELYDGARRFENWEFAYALLLGMGEAARYALDEVGVEPASVRAAELAAYARTRLRELDRVRVLDYGAELCAIVTADVGADAADIVRRLRERRIHTSETGTDVAIIDMTEKRAPSALRVSPHYYNTPAEVDALIEALAVLTRSCRR